MSAIVVTLLSIPAAQASAPGGVSLHRSATSELEGSPQNRRVSGAEFLRPKPCVPRLRRAVVSRRSATWHWQDELGIFRSRTARRARATTSCPYLGWIKKRWAVSADRHYRSWIATFTLNDFAFGSGDPWPNAIREVQRVFPGTEGWLLSCSDAEGWEPGSNVWIGYAGQRYSAWLRDSDTVGGPMQFRFSTFKGMFESGYRYVTSRGYRVPTRLKRGTYGSDFEWKDESWQTALGQAIAAGWARYTGADNQHWIASWSNGCR